jgi:hypothetical protein
MRTLRFVFGWLFMPGRLFALAALCAGAAVVLGYAAVHDAADRKLALRQGPPPAVAIEEYRPMAHRGPAGEVVLRARADLESGFVFTLPGSSERALLVPLFPLADGEAREAEGAIFLSLDGDTMPAAAALAARHPAGWVEVNGVETDAGPFRLMLAGALAADGRALGARVTVLRPFLDGREAAFQPPASPARAWAWLATVALGFALAAVYVEVRGLPPVPKATSAGPRASVVSARFAPLPQQEDEQRARGFTLWPMLRTGVRMAMAGMACLARAGAVSARALRDGIGEFRSPR